MISPEMLRRYPFFAGLSHEQLVTLAMMAGELNVEAGHRFFREGDELASFYLVTAGEVAVVFEVTARDVAQTVSRQLTGAVEKTDVTISQVGPGEPFGWTAITADHRATAGAIATQPSTVLSFDRNELLAAFEQDCHFGYGMIQQILQVARQRLHDLRVESLAQVVT